MVAPIGPAPAAEARSPNDGDRGHHRDQKRRVRRDHERHVDLDPVRLQRGHGRQIALVPGQRVGEETRGERLDEAADEPEVVFGGEGDEDRDAHGREERERPVQVRERPDVARREAIAEFEELDRAAEARERDPDQLRQAFSREKVREQRERADDVGRDRGNDEELIRIHPMAFALARESPVAE
jgi:hypothetical protein